MATRLVSKVDRYNDHADLIGMAAGSMVNVDLRRLDSLGQRSMSKHTPVCLLPAALAVHRLRALTAPWTPPALVARLANAMKHLAQHQRPAVHSTYQQRERAYASKQQVGKLLMNARNKK